MVIKKDWRREWARLLAKAILVAVLVIMLGLSVKVERVEGDAQAPKLQDGDLVMAFRWSDAPFLQVRVRGFDD